MWMFSNFVSALIGITLVNSQSTLVTQGERRKMLFDFRNVSNVDDWIESSDTVREVGMSKATLTLQKTQLFQRAVFFTLLNPQANGAGFAGMNTRTNFDLTGYNSIEMSCRAQGANENYKIILRDKGMSVHSEISYEQFFSVPTMETNFGTVRLNLSDFKAYFRGREVPNADPLDIANITMFGLQIYGGVYSPIKQRGVSSLEIDTIVATT